MNDSGEMMLNKTADQIHATAKSMVNIARKRIPAFDQRPDHS